MDFNIEIRRKQLENLEQFISSSKDKVGSILDYLGWNAENITKNQKETMKCVINPMHRIPTASAAAHIQACAWRKERYHEDDLPLSEPNPVPGSTIIIDDLTKVNVLNTALAANPLMKTGWRSQEPVPKTSNRLLATFTPDERLALYEFSVATTAAPPQVPEFNIEPKIEEKQNLTPRELKALERDAKRRRIKYKSKCVHTNSKSTTEILREIIDGQMELYEEWLQDKDKYKKSTSRSQSREKKPAEEDEPVESSNDVASPRSSRSQNSFKSQESRHRSYRRTRSKDRSRDRSRSRSRKKDTFANSRKRYDDNKSSDRNSRRYESRDYRSGSSHSRSRSEY